MKMYRLALPDVASIAGKSNATAAAFAMALLFAGAAKAAPTPGLMAAVHCNSGFVDFTTDPCPPRYGVFGDVGVAGVFGGSSAGYDSLAPGEVKSLDRTIGWAATSPADITNGAGGTLTTRGSARADFGDTGVSASMKINGLFYGSAVAMNATTTARSYSTDYLTVDGSGLPVGTLVGFNRRLDIDLQEASFTHPPPVDLWWVETDDFGGTGGRVGIQYKLHISVSRNAEGTDWEEAASLVGVKSCDLRYSSASGSLSWDGGCGAGAIPNFVELQANIFVKVGQPIRLQSELIGWAEVNLDGGPFDRFYGNDDDPRSASTSLSALSSMHVGFEPLGPGYRLVAASGHDYNLAAAVPEASTWMMWLVGLVLMALGAYQRQAVSFAGR